MEQKEKSSTASKIFSSRNSKSNKSSDSSHVANCTHKKLAQKSVNNLAKRLGNIRITKNKEMSIQEIYEWYLVGEEEANYNKPTTFKEAWY